MVRYEYTYMSAFTVFVHIITVYVCAHISVFSPWSASNNTVRWSWHTCNSQEDEWILWHIRLFLFSLSQSLSVICSQSCVHPLIVFKHTGGPNDTPETSWPVGRESIPTPAANTAECSLCVFTFSLSLPPLSTLAPPSHSNSSHFHATLSLWLLCEPWGKHSLPRFTLLPLFPCISRDPLLLLPGPRCCAARAQLALAHIDLHTQAHKHEHIQIFMHTDVVECAHSDSFELKSLNLIWISTQFALLNEFVFIFWRDSIWNEYQSMCAVMTHARSVFSPKSVLFMEKLV